MTFGSPTYARLMRGEDPIRRGTDESSSDDNDAGPSTWRSVRGRRPSAYPVGQPHISLGQGEPIRLGSDSEGHEADHRGESVFRRFSRVFTGRRHSEVPVQTQRHEEPLQGSRVNDTAGISIRDENGTTTLPQTPLRPHVPTPLGAVDEATSASGNASIEEHPTPTRAVPTPATSANDVPMSSQLPVNVNQPFAAGRAFSQTRDRPRSRTVSRRSSAPAFLPRDPVNLPPSRPISPLPSPSTPIDQMPDLRGASIDSNVEQEVTQRDNSRRLPPIDTGAQQRKTSLDPISPKNTTNAPTGQSDNLHARQESSDSRQDASADSTNDQGHSRQDSKFTDNAPKSPQQARAQGGSTSSAQSAAQRTRSRANTSTIPPATPEEPSSSQFPSTSNTPNRRRTIEIEEPPPPDRNTPEHQKVVEAARRKAEEERWKESRKRKMSLEAHRAMDEDRDPELSVLIDKHMRDIKRRKLVKMNRHRRVPNTTPIDDVVLTEAERKKVDEDARHAIRRQREKSLKAWYKRHPNDAKARKTWEKAELKLSKRPSSIDHSGFRSTTSSPIPCDGKVRPGPAPFNVRARFRYMKVRDVFCKTFKNGEGAMPISPDTSDVAGPSNRGGKGKGRAGDHETSPMSANRSDGTPYRTSSFTESLPGAAQSRRPSRPGSQRSTRSRQGSLTGRARSPPASTHLDDYPPVPPLPPGGSASGVGSSQGRGAPITYSSVNYREPFQCPTQEQDASAVERDMMSGGAGGLAGANTESKHDKGQQETQRRSRLHPWRMLRNTFRLDRRRDQRSFSPRLERCGRPLVRDGLPQVKVERSTSRSHSPNRYQRLRAAITRAFVRAGEIVTHFGEAMAGISVPTRFVMRVESPEGWPA
ncbi:hypothetical protein KVT40_001417 [Elsinoe batatas]|uniref:Uncharacterized protein n=1 Tax=Elsinoe batatas TaxID=2601811 RepID=A0A8K0LCQ2_9PEZI|nr:hypothetical protein KVT40_001417 [Elsinoe batatas]